MNRSFSTLRSRILSGEVERVLFCSGKVFYDLVAERAKRLGDAIQRVAIVRIEELYPWPEENLKAALGNIPAAKSFLWVQEEPANMGAWNFVRDRLEELLGDGTALGYAGRVPAASPAAGSARSHREEQAAFLAAAFEGVG